MEERGGCQKCASRSSLSCSTTVGLVGTEPQELPAAIYVQGVGVTERGRLRSQRSGAQAHELRLSPLILATWPSSLPADCDVLASVRALAYRHGSPEMRPWMDGTIHFSSA